MGSEFEIGSHVEVMSPVHSMLGALFPAKIVATSADGTKFTVEYDKAKTKMYRDVSGHKSVRDRVAAALLRPLPPREESYNAFKLNDTVDAFLAGGWWEGAVTKVLEDASFEVYFRFVKQTFEFEAEELRIHREWVGGAWVPPMVVTEDGSSTNNEQAQVKVEIGEGTEVEISNDEDGFEGSWFAATVVKVLGKDRFLVRYKSLKTDDDKEFLTEEKDAQHTRPCPPESVMVDCYVLNEEVEAYWNDGWWEGKICNVLHGGRYKVYFEATNDKMVFDHSDLRLRQIWVDGTWVMASQAFML